MLQFEQVEIFFYLFKLILTYEGFAIEREETPKKINFIFICQKCFKCYNLFRFYINSFFIFFGVSSLSIAKLPYLHAYILYILHTIIMNLIGIRINIKFNFSCNVI